MNDIVCHQYCVKSIGMTIVGFLSGYTWAQKK